MTSKTVVGLGGLLRSGKDTVADYLVEKHGYTKLFMSEPLLEMALVIDPYIPVRDFESSKYGRSLPAPRWVRMSDHYKELGNDYTALKENPEVRRFLQVLGTEVGRNMIDPDLWVKLAEKKIQNVLNEGGKVVITGIRFPNELNFVQDFDGENVWVERPSVRQKSEHSAHASEVTLDKNFFDRIVINDGTLDDLYSVVDGWMGA